MSLAIFDLDGTLVDQASGAKRWTERFAEKRRLSSSEADVIAAALASRRPKGEVFEEVAICLDLRDDPAELWANYREQIPSVVRCTTSTKAALERMRNAGWTIGIATNGQADNQVAKILNTGLSQLVDGWVVSSEICIRKPELGIFQALASQLGHPLDGWMVGDSLEHDIRGGANAGLKTAWITSEESIPEGATYYPSVVSPNIESAIDEILNSHR